jgi:hypothetical protein
MADGVIQIRLRTTRDLNLELRVLGFPETYQLGPTRQIQEEMHRFFSDVQEVVLARNPTIGIVTASQKLQKTIFPQILLEQLTHLFAHSKQIAKVITDDDGLNQIPWELFTYDANSDLLDQEGFWGYDHVFLRAYSKIQRTGGAKEEHARTVSQAGVLSFDGMPQVAEIRQVLSELADSGIMLNGHHPPRSSHKAEDLPGVIGFLEGLDIIHLSCLIVTFKYSEQAFLVFSEAFLLSLKDLQNELRFQHSPLIFLDACDNTWSLAHARFCFLTSLIEYGGSNVVTCFPPVPRQLAADFSACFYKQLASRIPTPYALLETRRFLLKQRGDPLALLFWLYGNPLSDVPRPVDYQYDVYISNSLEDATWVNDVLVPRLEQEGLRVCINSRDFEIGVPKLVNIEKGVERSRKTLLVLTPEWISSEWNDIDALLTQTKDPAGRRRRMLPLVLRTCTLPPRLDFLTPLDLTTSISHEFQMQRLVAAIRSK